MNKFEQSIKDQMLAEYPAMGVVGKTFTYTRNKMTFSNLDEIVGFLANQMWDAFDETLDNIEDKGEQVE